MRMAYSKKSLRGRVTAAAVRYTRANPWFVKNLVFGTVGFALYLMVIEMATR